MVVKFDKRISENSFLALEAWNLLELIFWLWIPVNPLPNWRAAAEQYTNDDISDENIC